VRDYNKKIGNTAYEIDPYTVLKAIETSSEEELFDLAGMGLDVDEATFTQKMGGPQ
jgi:hypothetical protein